MTSKWRAEGYLVQLPRYRASKSSLDEVHATADVPSPDVTDMHIERYLKADGPGVTALAAACRHFPNLTRLHAHGWVVNFGKIKTIGRELTRIQDKKDMNSVPSMDQVLGNQRGELEHLHGLALAVHGVAQICIVNSARLTVPAFAFSPGTATVLKAPSDLALIPMTSIEVPYGYTTIGDAPFAACTSLTSVKLPAGLERIGESAFSGCTALASVALPASLTTIRDDAFARCTALASVVFPAGLTTIGDYAFSGCTSLKSIVLPAGLTTIGASAFAGCSSLASVELPAGRQKIGDEAFRNCPMLEPFPIPYTVEHNLHSLFKQVRGRRGRRGRRGIDHRRTVVQT